MTGEQVPAEIKLLSAIDRFGVKAVLGRDVLSAGEISRARYAETIIGAYRARERSESWVEFANKNKQASRILNDAERLANGG